MVVDDQGSKYTPTSLDDSDVEFLILNWYNRNSNSVLEDDTSPSNTNPVIKDDPPFGDSSLQ